MTKGNISEAEIECRQIIGLEEKALGPEDLATLNSRGNLAVALIGQEKFPKPKIEYNDVLKLMERVLGFEHPDTLSYTSQDCYRFVASKQEWRSNRDRQGAEERARKALGPDNPSTQKYAQLVQDLVASPNK